MLRRSVALPLLVALLGSMAACTADDSAPAPRVAATPIEELDARALDLSSAPFCGGIGASAVEAAVGPGAVEGHWRSGDTIPVAPKVRDIAHENGCQWTGASRDVARAWAFVPPVTVRQARGLVRDARKAPGCRATPAHRFGRPATGVVCTTKGAREAAYHGLFGSTWLSCAVTDRGPERMTRAALRTRAGDWCVAVATAAASG